MNTSTIPIFRLLLLILSCVITCCFNAVAQTTHQNASDLSNPQPLAGFTEIRASKEIYLIWAQDNIFNNQLLDYFPTQQVEASILPGEISDVFAPSNVNSTLSQTNSTTRIAAVAADMDGSGIDQIIKATTTSNFDILLSRTIVGSALEITGNTTTTQIDASVSQDVKSKIMVLSGNFDVDLEREIVLIWPNGNGTNQDEVVIKIFDLENGQLDEIYSFTYQTPVHLFDATLADLDLNGQDEVVMTTLEENSQSAIAVTQVFGIIDAELIELQSLVVDEFSDQYAMDSDVSLSISKGDYDGDVAPEIALIFRQAYDDLLGQRIQLRIIQAVDRINTSEISVFEELLVLKNSTIVDESVEFPPSYGPIYASSGDLTGDGNDALAIQYPGRNSLIVLPLDTLTDFKAYTHELTLDFSDPIFCFTRGGQQTLDIQIADLNRDGSEELIYTIADGCTEDIISDNMVGARISTHVYDLTSPSEPTLTAALSNNANTQFFGLLSAALVLGDFNGDNFRLGQGRYFRKSELSQPLIVLNAPPIHFDKINDVLFDVNSCYGNNPCNFASTYFRSTTSSMRTSTTVSSAWSLSLTVEASATADAAFVKSSVEGSVTARYGEKFSKYRSSGERLEISTQVSAIEDDQIYATVSDYDIWEYPIYEKDSIIAHLISVVPTITEKRWFPSKSYNAFDYLPDHEVGNILSYRERQPRLSSVAKNISSDEFTLSANSVNKWTVNQQSFRQSGSSFEQEIGIEASVSVETEAQFKVFGGSLGATIEGEYETKQLSTHKTRVSEELEIEVELGGVDESIGEVKYAVKPYCYWAKNGALVVDYTTQPEVPAPGASDTWWSENYGQKSDPALILPWQYDPEKGLTLQDEQVKRFQSKSLAFSNATPNPGDTITIFVEVHNWSLLPTQNPVEVGFYLCDPTEESNRIMAVNGGMTISTGNVLDPRGNDILSFDWEIPEGLPTFPRIYARIDPDNREDEIHEENNFGFNILSISTNRAPCPAPMITSVQQLDNESAAEFVRVYPNPVQDKLFLDFTSNESRDWSLQLFDNLGRRILVSSKKNDTQNLSIDVNSLTTGLYFYRLQFDNILTTGRLLKL